MATHRRGAAGPGPSASHSEAAERGEQGASCVLPWGLLGVTA